MLKRPNLVSKLKSELSGKHTLLHFFTSREGILTQLTILLSKRSPFASGPDKSSSLAEKEIKKLCWSARFATTNQPGSQARRGVVEHGGKRGRFWVGFAQWCCTTQHRCSFPPPSSCQQSQRRVLIQGREAAVITKLWPEGLAPPALLLHPLQAQAASSALPAAGTPAQDWGHSGQHPPDGRS